jgi:acetyl-CoA acetyltransferase
MHPNIHMPMLQTAEVVAKRYNVSRDRQDEYGYQSQVRTAAAQAAGKFDDEIVPMTVTMAMVNKETKEVTTHEITLSKDEGNRPETTLESLKGLKPVIEGGCITAGNASQLSDGASASVLMEAKEAAAVASPRWVSIAAWPSPALNRTRWASAPSMPSPSC